MKNNKKIALVTGASKGIGKSIAKTLINEGYSVFLCARNEELLKKTCAEISASGYFPLDLANTNSTEELFKKITEKCGKIDILINNAGQYVWSPVEDTDNDDIDNLINLNLKTPYKLIKLFTPQMKKQKWGRIVNIGSISGIVGEANASLYSMTKSAFQGLTKSLALELAEYEITVNTINPGWVDTEITNYAENKSDFSANEIIETIPQRRYIEPDEIAALVKYLVSDEAKGMTAQSVSLCAGLSAG